MPWVLNIQIMLSIGLTVARDSGPALASSAMQGSILLKTEVSQRGQVQGRPQAGALARAQQTASGALGRAWGWRVTKQQEQAQGPAMQLAGPAWGWVDEARETAAAEKAPGLVRALWAGPGQGWAEGEVPG